MKKNFVNILVFLLVLHSLNQFWASNARAAGTGPVTLALSSGSGAPGAAVNLNLTMNASNAPLQPALLQWDVVTSSADVSSVSAAAAGTASAAGKTISCSVQTTPTVYTCILYSIDTNVMADGVVATITVNLKSPAVSTSTTVSLANAMAVDVDANILSSTAQNGTVTITQAADTTAPILSAGSPTGTLAAGTTSATMSLTTNENATCRYSLTSTTAYSSMTNNFATTGSTTHSTPITGLTNGGVYSYYVRCIDGSGNANSSSYLISFSVGQTSSVKYPRKITLSSFEGRSSITSYPTLTITVLTPVSTTTLETQTLTPDVSNNYTVTFLSTDPQIVNIRVKAGSYLSAILANIDTSVNTTAVISVPQMLAGDFNNDNIVNSVDYSSLNSNWNQNFAGTDINGDGIVNTIDFAILKNNFSKAGQ